MKKDKKKAIGGFFEFELYKGKEYYPDLIKLNLGRNCLEYILSATKYDKIYAPIYTCETIFRIVKKMDIELYFYKIDECLEPVMDFSILNSKTVFLYTNYFGVKDEFIRQLAESNVNLIIDNSQAFFSKPIENCHCFYSPRKFFGVPDGAYLYTSDRLMKQITKDESFHRMTHLMKRRDLGPEEAYKNFLQNEKELQREPLKKMSNLTRKLMSAIDYDKAKRQRVENFRFLHHNLSSSNKCSLNLDLPLAPMIYPYICNQKKLREKLIANRIFVASYWPNILDNCSKNSLEYYFAKTIIPLPIDHRYNTEDMQRIVDIIHS